MFIISNGIPKSGSTLLMYYTIEILKRHFGEEGQNYLEKWIRNGPVGGIKFFPWSKWTNYYEELLYSSNQIAPFVLKTHLDYVSLKAICTNSRGIISFYSIRDPRDILLSVIDHSLRSKMNGRGPFQYFNDIRSALPYVKGICNKGIEWINSGKANIIKYESLVASPLDVLMKIEHIITGNYNIKTLNEIIKYESNNREKGKYQFNKGRISRYNDELSYKDRILIENYLQHQIIRLGYTL